MPASAVVTITNPAIRNVPICAEDGVGKDQVQHVAAAPELVARNTDVGEENGEGAEDAGGLIVACFEQVRQRELREFTRSRRDEVDEQQPEPSAGGLPERRKAVFVGVLRAGKKGACADPRGEQRKHQHESGQRAAGDEVIGPGLDARGAVERNGEQRDDNHRQHHDIENGHARAPKEKSRQKNSGNNSARRRILSVSELRHFYASAFPDFNVSGAVYRTGYPPSRANVHRSRATAALKERRPDTY